MNYDNLLLKVILEEGGFFKRYSSQIKKLQLDNKHFNFLLNIIKEHYDEYKVVPDYDILKIKLTEELSNEQMVKVLTDTITFQIEERKISEGDIKYIKDNLVQRIQNSMIKQAMNNLDKGKTDGLHNDLKEIEKVSSSTEEYEIKMLWDYDEQLEREVIPTNIPMVDENGGVGRGEIGILLAPTGVGKSVFLSYLANNFMLGGSKVLHIVFEGATNDYIRLHRVKLGNPSNDMLKRGKTTSNLKVVKMHSGKTNLYDIQDLLDRFKDEGFVPDVICLDYLDLIAPTKVKKESWMSEINTSNELEEFCWRNHIVFWTAVQTNRSGLNNEIPTLGQIAGSVSKAQKASMILGLSRNNLQIEDNTADVAIIKNRYGKTATANNCLWNPDEMKINITPNENIILG